MRHFIKIIFFSLFILKVNISFAEDIIDMILVEKSDRVLKLIKNGHTVKQYNINLGFDPIGHKFSEGDGKTPEGLYYISYKLENSDFFISYKISYPNKWDYHNAKNINKSPGGYIMIHGEPINHINIKDWTNGCIALSNKDMKELE